MSFKVPSALLLLLALTEPAYAVSYTVLARVVPSTLWMKLAKEKPEFVDQSKPGKDAKLELQVTLDGTFTRSGWSLLVGTRKVEVAPDGAFQASVQITLPFSSITFVAVSPTGQIEQTKVTLQVNVLKDAAKPPPALMPKALPNAKAKPSLVPNSPFQFTAGAGLTLITFTQTGLQDFSEKAITAKASAVYTLVPRRWDFGVSSFVTVIPFGSNTEGFNARYLGINGRIAYTYAGIRDPWRLSFSAGIYYTTMSVTDSAFGLTNLIGPQFMPVLSRAFGGGKSLTTYFKFAPVTGLGESLAFSNRELATGLSWTQPLSIPYALSFSLDFAEISFVDADQVAKSKSITFGLSLLW